MKIAVLGVWHVHAIGYTPAAIEKGEVIGFFERNDALAKAFQEKFNLYRFSSLEELLNSEAEAVIVCSASCDHTDDMIAAANAKKDIFTEKVLALTTEECNSIRKAIEDNGVKFCISFFQKYLGSRIAMKRIAESGELGKINYLRFRNCHSGSTQDWLPEHFYNAKECGGGAMIDLGAHGMYLTHWILGMPVSAQSTFTFSISGGGAVEKNKDRVEDNAVTVLKYADGAIAINETGFVSVREPVVLELHGEKGYAIMTGDNIVKCTEATNYEIVKVDAAQSQPKPIEQFLDGQILEGCGIEEAIALTRLMEMAYGK